MVVIGKLDTVHPRKTRCRQRRLPLLPVLKGVSEAMAVISSEPCDERSYQVECAYMVDYVG